MTGDRDSDVLIEGFEARTLDKRQWTHAAHLTVGLAYVRAYGPAEAAQRMRENLRAYNAAVGGPLGAYHETMTQAWIAVIARFNVERRAHGPEPFAASRDALLARCGAKDYLLAHYSRELLFSNLARAEWVPPDLLKL